MPIPIKQLNAQIQAPNAATGKAVDASRSIEPILKDSVALNSAMGNFLNQLKVNADESKAQEAMRKYYDTMSSLKTAFQQTEGQDTINAVEELNKSQSKALADFDKDVAGVAPSIVNNAKKQISNYNMNLRESNNSHLFKETQKVQQANFNTSQDAAYENFALSVENYIDRGGSFASANDKEYEDFREQLGTILNNSMKYYTGHGMHKDVAFYNSKKDLDKAMTYVTNRISQKYGNEAALKFLDSNLAEKNMSEAARTKVYREREQGLLAHLVFMSDSRLYNQNGTVNKGKVKDLTPHLHDEERDIAIANAASARAAGVSELQAQELDRAALMDKDYILRQRYEMGIAQTKYYSGDALYDKEKFAADQASKIKDITPGKLLDLINHIDAQLNNGQLTATNKQYQNFLQEQRTDLMLKLYNMVDKGIVKNDWNGVEQNWFSTKDIKVSDALLYINGQMARKEKGEGLIFKDYTKATEDVWTSANTIQSFILNASNKDAVGSNFFNKIINRNRATNNPINLATVNFNDLSEADRMNVVEAYARFNYYNTLLDDSQRAAYLQKSEKELSKLNENKSVVSKTTRDRFNAAVGNVYRREQFRQARMSNIYITGNKI